MKYDYLLNFEKLSFKKTTFYASLIVGLWLGIFALYFLYMSYNNIFLKLTCLFLCAVLQHHLLSLFHEGTHKQFSADLKINDFTNDFFCGLPFFYTTKRYRGNHFRHHHFVNTSIDPDILNKDLKAWTFPKSKLQFLIFLLKASYFDYLKDYGYKVLRTFNAKRGLIFLYYVGIFLFLFAFTPISKTLVFWILPQYFFLSVFVKFRIICEHFGPLHQNLISRNIKGNFFEKFLFSPFNSAFHESHHKNPTLPFYKLADNVSSDNLTNINFIFGKKSALNDLVRSP